MADGAGMVTDGCYTFGSCTGLTVRLQNQRKLILSPRCWKVKVWLSHFWQLYRFDRPFAKSAEADFVTTVLEGKSLVVTLLAVVQV
ncbi:MAG: hypothetical protein IJ733_10165 [Lachnospiraceae bacterium]|nr:hypothetical protein [Lachnospiraceae bacterium]